jgi:hypothetical protein
MNATAQSASAETACEILHKALPRQLERIRREQLIRVCTQLSGRLLPAASQIYVRGHSDTCVTTGNLQTRQQMGTETHQYL